MAERGGASTNAGILYQNAVTALWLARMLDPNEGILLVRPEAPFMAAIAGRPPRRAFVDDIRIGRTGKSDVYCQVKIGPARAHWTWHASQREKDYLENPRNVWLQFFSQFATDQDDQLEFWTEYGAEVPTALCDKARAYERLDEFEAQLTRQEAAMFVSLREYLREVDGVTVGSTHIRDFLRRVSFEQHRQSSVERLARAYLQAFGGSERLDVAWNTLFVHAVCSARERRSITRADVVGLLARDDFVELRPELIVTDYIEWLKKRTATFSVPALSSPLPISDAGEDLKVMMVFEARPRSAASGDILELEDQSEWLSQTPGTFKATEVVEHGGRVVIVGAPGSGKSTLLRRAAHDLATRGERVLLVRLPSVAARQRSGESLAQALVRVATGDLVEPTIALSKALENPDCVLMDGLDECGSGRQVLAEQIAAWAIGHPNTRIVLATRPVEGLALLAKWTQVEIQPLDEREVDRLEGVLKGRQGSW